MSKLDIFLLALKNFRRRMARSILTIIGVVIGSMAIVVMVSLGIGIQDSMMMMIERWGDLTTVSVPLWNLEQEGGGSRTFQTRGGAGMVVMDRVGGGGGSSRRNEKNPYYEAQANIEAIEHVTVVMLFRSDTVRLVSGRYVSPWTHIGLVDVSKIHHFNIGTSQGRMLEPGDPDFAMVLNPFMGTDFLNMRQRDPWDWRRRPTDEEGRIIPFVDIFNDPIQLTFDDRFGERPQPGESRRRPQLFDVEVVGFQDDFGNFSWYNFINNESFTRNKKAYLETQLRNATEEEQRKTIREQIERLHKYDEAYVKVDHRDNVVAVVEQLRDMGLEGRSNMEMVDNVNSQMAMIQLVMGAIGAVALIVAAINIANTLIMSIYERTKEIGIMKVLGCRLGDILLLFQFEAMILGIIGGFVGIGASFGASALLNNLPAETINSVFGFYVDPTVGARLSVIPFWLTLLSIGISVGVAVLAGLYPSIRAMRLSALEAIRNE